MSPRIIGGGGIGRMLVEAAVSDARRHGAGTLHLEVREDNTPARRLYTAHGFQTVGVRRDYYRGRDGILRNAVSMSKAINQQGD